MNVQVQVGSTADVAVDHIAEICLGEPVLAQTVRDILARVETLLFETVSLGEGFLAEPALHLMNAGGKRFRPLVTILAAQFGDQPAKTTVLNAAAATEMIHLATLHHDDVMDESAIRRGVPTVNARWSNTVAILSGDYLLVRAGQLLLGQTDGCSAAERMHDTVTALVTGQMREASRVDGSYDPEVYLRTIEEKTASLISWAAWAGAALAGAPPETAACVERVGELLGMVFQISDDILDLTVSTDRLGKTQGLDLREGVATLPVIYALAEDTAAARSLTSLLAEPVNDGATVHHAIELIRRTSGLERAEATMARYVDQAHSLLAQLDPTPVRTAWDRLIDLTATRTH